MPAQDGSRRGTRAPTRIRWSGLWQKPRSLLYKYRNPVDSIWIRDFSWSWESLGYSESAGRLVNQSPVASDSSQIVPEMQLAVTTGAGVLDLGVLLCISAG